MVEADVPGQVAERAGAVDGVAGVADLDRQVVGGGRRALGRPAGDEVVARALVGVVVDLDVRLQGLGDVVVPGDVIEVVVTQDLAVGVGDVGQLLRRLGGDALARGRRGCGHRAVGAVEVALPVRRIAAPIPAEAVDHVLRQVGIVGLVGARDVGEGRDQAAVEPVLRLAVELGLGGPRARALVHEQVLRGEVPGEIGREAVVFAGVQAREGALGVLAAERLVDLDPKRLARVARGVGHRAAEVAGRGDAEAGDAGREVGAAEVVGDQRAADGEAVVVVVGAVAERHAVQRVAEVGGAEAAHLQGQRLLVEAQGVDRPRADARQEVQQLLHARAGRQDLQVRRLHGRDRAGGAGGDDDDLLDRVGAPLHGRHLGGLHRHRAVGRGPRAQAGSAQQPVQRLPRREIPGQGLGALAPGRFGLEHDLHLALLGQLVEGRAQVLGRDVEMDRLGRAGGLRHGGAGQRQAGAAGEGQRAEGGAKSLGHGSNNPPGAAPVWGPFKPRDGCSWKTRSEEIKKLLCRPEQDSRALFFGFRAYPLDFRTGRPSAS